MPTYSVYYTPSVLVFRETWIRKRGPTYRRNINMVECTWWCGGCDLWWVGVENREVRGRVWGHTHKHRLNLKRTPHHDHLNKTMKSGRMVGWQTFVVMHSLACFKWDGLVADWNWSCREWHLSNRLCPNLRICSSSCLHNEVKWSEEMHGWPWQKQSTPDVPLTNLAWARANSEPLGVKY